MDRILKNIMEGTVGETGEDFFAALVKNLAQSMDVSAAWVTEYVAEYRQLKSLAFWLNGELVPEVDISVEGSPCEVVLEKGRVLWVADEVSGEFPDDPDLKKMGMIGYIGIPFKDADGVVVGHLAVFDRKPLRGRKSAFFLMRIFAARAAAELRRIRAEARVIEREEKLSRLLDTAPDAILELDDTLTIRLLNRAARTVFGVEKDAGLGRSISDFLSNESHDNFQRSCRRLSTDSRTPGPVWVPEALTAKSADGSSFPAEATLSRIHDAEHPTFILILRNINDRLAAEEKIRSLGHEKGAFTGATQRRLGRFAQANGGTLFLDEVADLDLDLQAKLLRALQESEFEPVGSTVTQKVDVRVIAATNRDLRAAVDTGRFREDLYFRLNVFPLTLPSLRERGDDVALLAQSFAGKAARRLGRDMAPLSPKDITRLKLYPWPGNVRELQNVIERAVITAEGGRLNFDRALPETTSDSSAGKPSKDESTTTDSPPIRTAAQMIELERENLRRALTATGWRVSGEKGAARLLGMPPSTLNSRLKALNLK